MKHLIIYAHPSEGSFNHAILTTAVEGLKQKDMMWLFVIYMQSTFNL